MPSAVELPPRPDFVHKVHCNNRLSRGTDNDKDDVTVMLQWKTTLTFVYHDGIMSAITKTC